MRIKNIMDSFHIKHEAKDVSAPVNPFTKYDALGEYLSYTGNDEVTLSFDQMKEILGFDLPQSVYTYNAWWANSGHSQAAGWAAYGYKTQDVHPSQLKITFRRDG